MDCQGSRPVGRMCIINEGILMLRNFFASIVFNNF